MEQKKEPKADGASPEQDAELDAIFWGVVGPAPPPPKPPGSGARDGGRPVRPMMQVAGKAKAGSGSLSDSGSGGDTPR